MNAPWPSGRKHRGPLGNGENTRYFASRMVLVLITPFAVIAYYFLVLYLGYLLDYFLHGTK